MRRSIMALICGVTVLGGVAAQAAPMKFEKLMAPGSGPEWQQLSEQDRKDTLKYLIGETVHNEKKKLSPQTENELSTQIGECLNKQTGEQSAFSGIFDKQNLFSIYHYCALQSGLATHSKRK